MTEFHASKFIFKGAAFILLMPLILFFSFASLAAAETRLTPGSGHYFQPDISGNKVVWLKGTNDGGKWSPFSDVYLHTLGGSTVKLNSVKQGHAPSISGSDVVWEDRRNGSTATNVDIFRYDLPSGPEVAVETQGSNQFYPQTDGGRVVWMDFRNYDWDVYLKDTDGSIYRITTDAKDQTEPRLDGDLIVFTDDRNSPGWDDIYVYDLSEDSDDDGTPNYKEGVRPSPDPAEVRITTNSAKQNGPDISGRKIVWTDWRSGRNIYTYDLDNPVVNGSPVDANAAIQHSARIDGDLVVWTDWRNTTYPTGINTDIYARDLGIGRTTQITTNGGTQVNPAVSGSNIVWGDFRSRYWDVYHTVYFIDTKAPVTSISSPGISAQDSNSTKFKVAWSATDPAPSHGLGAYDVQYKERAGGAWKNWRVNTGGTYGYFTGAVGKTYYFRARAKDSSGNQGGWSAIKSTVVPYDQDSLIHRKVGFLGRYKKAGSSHYLGTSRFSKTRGNIIAYKFYGNKVTLISKKGPNQSKAKIYIDGKHRATVDTYASSTKYRQAVFTASWPKAGTHFVKIENLGTPGRTRFDIDGLAVKDTPVDIRKPTARVFAPPISSNISKTTKFRVAWAGSDPAPFSGVASYDVWYRRANSRTWTGWRSRTPYTYGYFGGRRGVTYFFKVRARDFAGNVGRWSKSRKTIVPYDQDQKVRRRAGFLQTYANRRSDHYLGTSRFSKVRNTYVAYKFYGNKVSLVSNRGRNRSRAKIYIDGKYVRTIDTYSKTYEFRKVVFTRAWAKKGTHYLKVVNLATPGRPRFDVDGVAVGR